MWCKGLLVLAVLLAAFVAGALVAAWEAWHE